MPESSPLLSNPAKPPRSWPTLEQLRAADITAGAGRSSWPTLETLRAAHNTAGAEAKQIAKETLSGEDPLGATVAAVSRHTKCGDRLMHWLNPIGFAWADEHRVLLMSINLALGAVIFGLTVCGAMGLGSGALWNLPWGEINNVRVSQYIIAWWDCGHIDPIQRCPKRYHQDLVHLPNCTREQTDLLTCAKMGLDVDSGGDVVHGDVVQTALISIHVNQWGLCMFSEGWPKQVWGYPMTERVPLQLESDGFCRPWHMVEMPEYRWLAACQAGCVDAITLIMSCFGGFTKLLEPLSRMRKSTDKSQKTVVLIIGLVSIIAPVIALVQFGNGCLRDMEDFSQRVELNDSPSALGTGALCFMISVGLYVPIYAIHILVPAGVVSARQSVSGD